MQLHELRTHITEGVYQTRSRDFFEDLCEVFNLDPNERVVQKMYSLAWSNGHSAGYHEVLSHFQDLVEVFKDSDV